MNAIAGPDIFFSFPFAYWPGPFDKHAVGPQNFQSCKIDVANLYMTRRKWVCTGSTRFSELIKLRFTSH